MKKYMEPEMEISAFEVEDVITNSLPGFGGDPNDGFEQDPD